MPLTVLRAADHRTMPWKNGGGSTTEIAAAPDGAGIDAFDWRVSMAVVAADGPFSEFPGIDRTLSILDGSGLILKGLDQGPVRLERTAEPFGFPADAAVSAALIDGPITDLNVMVRRGRFHDRTRRLSASRSVSARCQATVALLLAETPCRVAIGSDAVDLGHRDALLLDRPDGVTLTLSSDGSLEAYLVEMVAAG